MFPRKIRKPARNSDRWQNAAHRNFVRKHECSIPGCNGRPIEVAHVRLGSGAGMGRKPDDWRAVSLCGGPSGHHAEQHRVGEATFWSRYAVDVDRLIDEFCRRSPVAAKIREVRNAS